MILKKIFYLRAKYFLRKENFLEILDLSKKNMTLTQSNITEFKKVANNKNLI